jgi:hypothetical protein
MRIIAPPETVGTAAAGVRVAVAVRLGVGVKVAVAGSSIPG